MTAGSLHKMRYEADADIYLTPNRAYSPTLGRWLSPDPLGTIPNAKIGNRFSPLKQFYDGLNLYEYCGNDPINGRDDLGLETVSLGGMAYMNNGSFYATPPCSQASRKGTCGPDVTKAILKLRIKMAKSFSKMSDDERNEVCWKSYDGELGWDIYQFYDKGDMFIGNSKDYPGDGTCQCKNTVWFLGKCYSASKLNYYLWGLGRQLCGDSLKKAHKDAETWKKEVYGHYLSVEAADSIRAGYSGTDIRSCHIGCKKPKHSVNSLNYNWGGWDLWDDRARYIVPIVDEIR